MKKLLLFLLSVVSITTYAQGPNSFGGVALRVNDTTTYQTNAAAFHTAGYYDIYFNNQATNDHWDVWNGSGYDHIFSFGSGGGGTPGGATTQVQFNNAGAFGGDADFLFTGGNLLTVPLVKITSGSPGANKVLTSDADGDGSWVTPEVTLTGTETLTNKRWTPRVQSVSSSATVTPNADTDDAVKITAQAAGLTLANPSGTPTTMQAMVIRLKDNGTARAITYGSQYRAIGIVLPTTTVISKTLYLGMIWNDADTKWDVVGYSLEP
jgi:hypothetical protein